MKKIIALAIITSLAASGTVFARDGGGGAGAGGGESDNNRTITIHGNSTKTANSGNSGNSKRKAAWGWTVQILPHIENNHASRAKGFQFDMMGHHMLSRASNRSTNRASTTAAGGAKGGNVEFEWAVEEAKKANRNDCIVTEQGCRRYAAR